MVIDCSVAILNTSNANLLLSKLLEVIDCVALEGLNRILGRSRNQSKFFCVAIAGLNRTKL